MANSYNTNTFSTTYNDDYTDSAGYHRILFNSGRAVQARELTQLQTIIQEEIGRFGRNIFKEGAAVNPGGMTLNNSYEFIKIDPSSILPTDINSVIGTVYIGQTSNVSVRVLEFVAAEGSDPTTLYVQYLNTSSGTSGAAPIRITPGEIIDNGSDPVLVQATNTSSNRAVGQGTRVSLANGDFFTQGHFVFAKAQSKIISKYDSKPNVDIGFKVIQDIVTINDTNDLYDNAGQTLNLSAPGADRFRIRLEIATRDEIDSDENFVYVGQISGGKLVDTVSGQDDYNRINDLLAKRTKEESGDYNVKEFKIKFDENDSDTSVLDVDVSSGISYVDGYRVENPYSLKLTLPRAQDTATVNNEVVAANYGSYVNVTSLHGVPNPFSVVSFRTGTDFSGSSMGTAFVRAIEKESDTEYRIFLFDIDLNNGTSFRDIRSVGTSVNDYGNLILENSKAVLKSNVNNNLLFKLPRERPKTLSDISLVTQRVLTTTTDGSGNGTLTLTNPSETFSNTLDWIVSNADSAVATNVTITGAGTQSATISGGPISSSNLEILTYVNNSSAQARSKTLTENTISNSIDSDGNGTNFISLDKADVYSVSRITSIDSDGVDLTSKFVIDDGQRDNFYDIGKLVLKGGQTAPVGNVFVRYKYFTHGTSGKFFNVNSYTGQVEYTDIPSHRLADGTVVSLRDVMDFRPVKNSSNNFSGGDARVNELPQNTNLITLDAVYYQPRFSKLVANRSGNIELISGPSSLNPILPITPDEALDLYNIKLNAFTLNDSDMVVEKIDTKRYTMADIGRIDDRVERLEELTALNLLELSTQTFDVLDSNGLNRTKSGFLVDNFVDHFSSQIISSEYRASIDPQQRILRPTFTENNVSLKYDSDASTNVVQRGDNVYLKYTDTSYVNQNLATGTENINPFAVITNLGTVTLSPSSDDWKEIKRIAPRVIDGGTRLSQNQAQLWNNWQWNWSGVRTSGTLNQNVVGSSLTTANSQRSGRRVVITETIREVVGDRIVDIAIIPFMRSTKVYFRAEGMRPNTRLYPYFDNRAVSAWCRSEPFQRISNNRIDYGNKFNRTTAHPEGFTSLTTNSAGKVEGSFFVPNSSALKFRTGIREFKLLDITKNIDADALTIGRANFAAEGVIETRQADILTTRSISSSTINRDRDTADEERRRSEPRDPLAQSFYVNEVDGIFLTKVDTFFKTKDDTIPVELQIRPMVNGSPSSTEIIPGSSIYLDPTSVNTSSDASIATTFTFEEPIYLKSQTEYCVVLLAESVEYTTFVAETYKFVLGSTEKRVTKQPTLGSLFKSQNGSTWQPDQTKDLMFNLYRAEFNLSTTAEIILENNDVPIELLDTDPLTTDSGNSTITVFQPSHGMFINDEVKITGLDSATTYAGIKGTSLMGSRTITAIDHNGYTFDADSNANSTSLIGGSNVFASKNILFDIVVPNIQTMVTRNTNISAQAKFTSGKSLAGNETPYQTSSNYSDIFLLENNVMTTPKIIANSDIELVELGAGVKSTTVKLIVNSTNSNISPVVDLQRSSLFCIGNNIDKQSDSVSSGFNIPLSYVDETDPANGSASSKHIVVPVTLEEDAVGIKVLLAANRPSESNFDVYYRTGSDETNLNTIPWTKSPLEFNVPSDENNEIFREYEYLIGGNGGTLTPFNQFQVKIVFNSINSARVPTIRDLRIIALGV